MLVDELVLGSAPLDLGFQVTDIARGLLVKRHVLSHRSSCGDVDANDPQCWTSAHFNKTILLIIDALRFDFVFPAHNGIERMDSPSKYYIGQMPLVAELLKSSNAGLFALVTGAEVVEDNIVDQFISRSRNVTLLGDDTWLQLLPGRFNRHFEGPSFDIKDLDTVDNIVIAHIYDELNRTDWSLMIAHCLGVDHAGHRYGPMHPEMSRKLGQMDELVRNVTEEMPDDAVLFVLGDHGMTQTGDHGADSPAEVSSALFVYSNRLNVMANLSNILTVHQVDLVPTLALLLDVPIPFSSIGLMIDTISFTNRNCKNNFAKSFVNMKTLLTILIRISIFLFLLLDNAEEWITMRLWVFRSALLFLQLSLVFADDPTTDMVIFSLTSLGVSLFSQTMVISYKLFGFFADKNPPFSRSLCLTLFVSLVLSLLPMSNSYIIYESDVLRFFLQSVVCVLMLRKLNEKRPLRYQEIPEELKYAFGFLFITRFLKDFEGCREEQVGCFSDNFEKGTMFLLSVMFALGVIWILLEEHSGRVHILTRAFVWSMAVLLILHWAFELSVVGTVPGIVEYGLSAEVSNLHMNKRFVESVSRRLAQIVYIAFFAHLSIFRWLKDPVTSALAGYPYGLQMALTLILFSMSDPLTSMESVWTSVILLHFIGSIPWHAAFIGLPGNFPFKLLPALLVLCNMFSGKVLASLLVFKREKDNTVEGPFCMLLFVGLRVFGSSMAAFIHHQHLMFFKLQHFYFLVQLAKEEIVGGRE
uniref:GPI ethanolamine phosphate transferase 3 n=1 Tax=Globodera rostochiensis TaxID=31243 RepID=A0A914GSZ2_GLORO